MEFLLELSVLSAYYEYENNHYLTKNEESFMEAVKDNTEEFQVSSIVERAVGFVTGTKEIIERSIQTIIEQVKKFYQEMRDRIDRFKSSLELDHYDKRTMFRLKVDLGDKSLAKEVMGICKMQSQALKDLNKIWLDVTGDKIDNASAIASINQIRFNYDIKVNEQVQRIANRYMSVKTGMDKSNRQYTLDQVKRRGHRPPSLKNNISKSLEDEVTKFYHQLPASSKRFSQTQEQQMVSQLINAINSAAASITMKISTSSVGALSGLENYIVVPGQIVNNTYNTYNTYNKNKTVSKKNQGREYDNSNIGVDDEIHGESGDDDLTNFIGSLLNEYEDIDSSDSYPSFIESDSDNDINLGDDFINSLFDENGDEPLNDNLDDLDSLFDNL